MEDMFTVTPMSQTVMLTPGETYEGEIMVANPAAATNDFEFKVEATGYGVENGSYAANFQDGTGQTEILKWITIENPTGKIAANETATVKFKIEVPENAAGGGQYMALMVGSASREVGDQSINVSNIYEMASLIYAQVDGEIVQSGEILENSFPGFITSLPLETKAVFKNDGNVHAIAKVTTTIKDCLTQTTLYPTENDDGARDEIVMPETTRDFTREIDGMSPLGVFEVSQTAEYLGQSVTETHVVVACPIWFMVLLVVFVATVTGVFIRLRKRFKEKSVVV